MGLDFDYPGRDRQSAPRWSYSGFHHFRCVLASMIGIDLDAMRGFGGLRGKAAGESEWSSDDPIVTLLRHSDCDGEMSPEECAIVAPRLREMVTPWADDYDRQNGLALADAMDACSREGVPLEFC